MKKNEYTGFSPLVLKQVKYFCWELRQIPMLANEPEEDLAQLLLCKLLPELKKYNPKKSKLHTYVGRVLRNVYYEMQRYYTSIKRNDADTWSLDDPHMVYEENQKKKDQNCQSLWTEVSPDRDEDAYLLAVDMENLIERLPESRQDLCKALQTQPVADIAKSRQVSRQSIYREMKKLKTNFEDVHPCL